jgi:hypothetical protein
MTDKRYIKLLLWSVGLGEMDKCEKAADALIAKGFSRQSENTIELPCKIGDTVYIIDDSADEYGEPYVLAVKVLQFFINENGIALDLKMPLGLRMNTWAIVGKNVFLTEAEAEKALAKMKGGAE